MRLYALFRTNYRNGWKPIHTWRAPTLTLTYTRAGYTGDAAFELDADLPLGVELQLLDETHTTRYLAVITDKTYRAHSNAYLYRARGICEHFLDLPFPYTDLNRQAERTGAAQSIWEYHLANHLARHTPRYQPLYNLNLASLRTRDIQLRTVRDAYKLYQSLKPCRITPEILPTGRIRMILEDLPLTPYPLPKDALWEITESIRETYTRLSINNPANQLIPDRRIANPEYWQLVVPAGATASIAPLDPNHYGYLGAYATRIDCEIVSPVWVGVQLRQPIRAPKSNTGAYAPITIGYYARGDNARVRIRVNAATSPDEVFNDLNAGYTETAYTLTPNTDELTLTNPLRPHSPPHSSSTASTPSQEANPSPNATTRPTSPSLRRYPPTSPQAQSQLSTLPSRKAAMSTTWLCAGRRSKPRPRRPQARLSKSCNPRATSPAASSPDPTPPCCAYNLPTPSRPNPATRSTSCTAQPPTPKRASTRATATSTHPSTSTQPTSHTLSPPTPAPPQHSPRSSRPHTRCPKSGK